MGIKVIELRELKSDPERVFRDCYRSGESAVVHLSDGEYVAMRPVAEPDNLIDDLIENNEEFRDVLRKSLASPKRRLKLT